MTLTTRQDAFGHAVWDYFNGLAGYEIIERSDGHFAISGGPAMYLSDYSAWPAHEKAAIEQASGRVLDIGCNAGRHALHLQNRGCDVLGVDVSPLAIKTAKRRGVSHARTLGIAQLSSRLGKFDTVLMLGNNFGLLGSERRARWLLRRFKSFTHSGSKIIVESLDVYRTRDPDHLSYLAQNRRKGRMSGQIRIRCRYKRFVTPWFDYLMVSQDEMQKLLVGTGWRVTSYYDSPGSRPVYAAVIERE
jgi:SAM-dependent methyltransferase